eukprot:SAG31_NODE_10352_length_1150_cov_1.358706_2_plen_169_part_01
MWDSQTVGHALRIQNAVADLVSFGWLGPAPPYVSLYTPGEGGSRDVDLFDNPTAGKSKADPLKHKSGMYLRWDPNHGSAAAGQKAWEELLEKYESLPPVDAAGVPQQQVAMVEFDGGDNPWEDSPWVAPRSGAQLTAERLTNMLRGMGHLGKAQRVSKLEAVPLALQGV